MVGRPSTKELPTLIEDQVPPCQVKIAHIINIILSPIFFEVGLGMRK